MITLLGSTGYVGQAFVEEMTNRKIGFHEVGRGLVDYYDLEALVNYIQKFNPSFLINCAGYTGKPNVDACESNKGECWKANVDLPKNIAMACSMMGVPWGHVSSGCIYQGDKGNHKGFTEDDEPNFSFKHKNCSYYSGTKVEGEQMVKFNSDYHYVWRLRIPFNNEDGPRNYLSKMMKYNQLLEAENSVSHLSDFVKACLDLYKKKANYGIYNVVNTGFITTSFVVEKIKEITGVDKDYVFLKNEEELYQIGAKAPRSSCILDNSKLRNAGVEIRSAEEAIVDSIKNWTPQV